MRWQSVRARIAHLERWREKVDQQIAELTQALADLKKALADAVTRIDAKLNDLQSNHPDLSAEIQEVRDDIVAVQGLAAEPAPPVTTDQNPSPAPPEPPTV
jgi:prefoldin subunit 5